MLKRLKEIANVEVSDRLAGRIVEFALAVWTFCQIVFVHSAIGASSFVSNYPFIEFYQALVAGCLIAGLAAQGVNMRPVGVISLFFALFASLAVWRSLGNVHIIVLLLFALLAKDTDVYRLVRIYTFSALLGLLVVAFFLLIRMAHNFIILNGTSVQLAYGFYDLETFPCILLSVLVGIVIGSREKVPWWHFLVVCSIVAIMSVAVIRSFVTALLVLCYCVAVVGRRLSARVREATNGGLFRLFVAILPLVIFCVQADAPKLFGFPAVTGGYSTLVSTFGYGALVVVAVLYVRSVLLMEESDWKTSLPFAYMLFSVLLLFTQVPLCLECNCTLLFLSYGVSGSKRLMPCAEDSLEVLQ